MRKLKATAQLAISVFAEFKLQLNWKAGKSEALVDLRGKGAKASKAWLFAEKESQLDLSVEGRAGPMLRVAQCYKHLGGMVEAGGGITMEVRHRAGQASSSTTSLINSVLVKPQIPLESRAQMATALISTRLLYNSGT